jgi:tRNA 5-methylaminomethyl-2-thiouridine biosynthesis bifunctional protein
LKQEKTPKLVETADGSMTMTHPGLGEDYHSKSGALSEAQGLYIEGSGFASRLHCDKPLSVLDVGLGLGYNALSTIGCWADSDVAQDLHILSLEIDAELVNLLASGQGPWQVNWNPKWLRYVASLKHAHPLLWQAKIPHPRHEAVCCYWKVAIGNGSSLPLQSLKHQFFDFIWQDPFSPKHGDTLWDEAWFRKIRNLCADSAVLMTYSTAGLVKRALASAGWQWKKIPGQGKREWLKASLNPLN